MFEIFKKEIKIGDVIKLYLTTGKEPEGTVVEIGDTYVLMQDNAEVKSRYFDKIIGGWDIISTKKNETVNIPEIKKHIPVIDEFKKSKIVDYNSYDALKSVENELNTYIRESKFDLALKKINDLLKTNIPTKYKSSILLKKAQLFSSQNKPIESEKSYIEVIEFNQKIDSSPNNLSHLYSELARLQSLNSKKQEAIRSAQKALKLNSKNSFAEKILNQLQSNSNIIKINDFAIAEQNQQNENLLIEDSDETFSISKLIDIDLEEHKFTDSEIISNNGKPTSIIAKRLLESAKEKKKGDLSDRYPVYLEAAKAFRELNIGSYDSREYIEAVAYYSMLKGSSLFIKFRNAVINNEYDLLLLTRLKDCACSYLIEALNVMSNIKKELLLTILTNYLKLNIVFYSIKSNNKEDLTKLFKGQFAETFEFCVKNTNKDIERIAYSTIIAIGAASIDAWNKFFILPNGTRRLYAEFSNESKRQEIYKLLCEVEDVKIDLTLMPGHFLKTIFGYRKKQSLDFTNNFAKLLLLEFTHNNFTSIKINFEQLNLFDNLLNDTDKEIKNEVNRVINIVLPYINRNQTERTNILIQARAIIEKTLTFISGNTTYYGRTLYYSLLKKWKGQIDNLLEERIAKSYPVFEVIIDPPYFYQQENNFFIPIILKNIGESTSTGYQAEYYINTNQIKLEKEFENIIKQEIPAGSQISIDLLINGNLSNFNSIDFKIQISPVYQDKVLESNSFSFTIEKEPTSNLIYDDIPWKDGPIPSEQMFKGRKKLVMNLAQHYLSIDRDKPYILYGLTRTGKSSILKYLQKELENETVRINGNEFTIKTFSWDFSEAASQDKAGDFYYYTLYEKTYEPIIEMLNSYKSIKGNLQIKESVRFKDFKTIIEFLHENQIYPIFFIDEFSFIKNLMDKGTINSAYLHSLRQFSLNELASFIFSGTYDIKHLVKNEKYGITGQLVNTIEHQVNEIEPKHSEELINVIKEKLTFTNEAIEQIKFLSGNVPYFIQIICKNCGYYAVENRRKIIGFPELEYVINIITGKKQESSNSLIKKLPEGSFQNNQFSPQDPREVACLISTIEFLNRNNIKQRGISYAELEKFWAEKKLTGFRPRLAEAITILKEKKIIIQYEDETMPVYRLSVDLFRRWWSNHHPDMDLVFNTLRDE